MLEYEVNTSMDSPFYYMYKIKEGDTLYKISKQFNVNTNLLAQLNGLELDDYIYENQTILIPKKEVSYYITKDGDTLNTVSRLFDVSEEDLIEQNKTLYLQKEQMIFYKRD